MAEILFGSSSMTQNEYSLPECKKRDKKSEVVRDKTTNTLREAHRCKNKKCGWTFCEAAIIKGECPGPVRACAEMMGRDSRGTQSTFMVMLCLIFLVGMVAGLGIGYTTGYRNGQIEAQPGIYESGYSAGAAAQKITDTIEMQYHPCEWYNRDRFYINVGTPYYKNDNKCHVLIDKRAYSAEGKKTYEYDMPEWLCET